MNLNGAIIIVDSCRFGEWEETIMKQWYESLFENYAQKYDKECFVQGTLRECAVSYTHLTLPTILLV